MSKCNKENRKQNELLAKNINLEYWSIGPIPH